ncbi:MAG: cytochrome P450 [Alphaproteobacteria bacterium]|nr:cytochrome P450 [Alphaproteobacteria bacterium]
MVLVYDPSDPAQLADPFPTFRELRQSAPVHYSPPLRGWVAVRYEEVRQATLDRRLSPDRLRPFFARLPEDQRARVKSLETYLASWAVFRDPPDHTRLRGLMNRAFTSRAIEAVRPNIRRIVDDLLDGVVERGEADFIADFAYPLPASVIMDMLGVPRADLAKVRAWSRDIALFIGSAVSTPDKYDRAEAGTGAMAEFFRGLLAKRKAAPREDLMSALIAARDGEGKLSDDETVACCILMLFGGHETTTNLIGNGVLALLRDPAALARLGADPALDASAVEEFLRFDGPSGALTRVALEDIELGGQAIAKGQRLFAMLNAANRDPKVFADPERLDLGRADNRHLAFGHGAHFCLGAPLARAEALVAFRAVLDRLPGLAQGAGELRWMDSFVFRGVEALPIVFRPTARVQAA